VARTRWVPPSRDRPSAARAHGAQDPGQARQQAGTQAKASAAHASTPSRSRSEALRAHPGSSALPALRRGLPGPRATRPPPHLLALQRPRCRRLSARRTRRGKGDRRDSGPRVGRQVALPRSLRGIAHAGVRRLVQNGDRIPDQHEPRSVTGSRADACPARHNAQPRCARTPTRPHRPAPPATATHSGRTSHTLLAAFGAPPVARLPSKGQILRDAGGPSSALSRRKPGFESR